MTKFDKIMKAIYDAGGRVFYVGGYVRDNIMGVESKDIDVEIHGISVAATEVVLSQFGSVDRVGVSFGVLKLKGMDIDFTFPRAESKSGTKHTDFEVMVNPFMPMEEAASRRDFTMNAVMRDVMTGEIFDFYGGQKAIEDKVIKMVDPNSFIDDNLRPLRACQFAARFNMTLDPELIALSKTLDYTSLSKERVTEEINKALRSKNPSVAFNYLREIGVIEQMFPELFALIDCPQNPEFHPEGDVWNHTMFVLDGAAEVAHKSSNPLGFMYLALLHDIGKPATTERNNKGNWAAHKHDIVGAKMIPEALGRLTDEKSFVKYVTEMTFEHMRAHKITEMSDAKVRRMMAEINFFDMLLFNIADCYKGGDSIDSAIIESEYNEKIKIGEALASGGEMVVKPKIQGRDLIAMGVKPGPHMKTLLDFAFEEQLRGSTDDHIHRCLTNQIKKLDESFVSKR